MIDNELECGAGLSAVLVHRCCCQQDLLVAVREERGGRSWCYLAEWRVKDGRCQSGLDLDRDSKMTDGQDSLW